MTRLWRIPLLVVLACVYALPCVAQCGFEVEPAGLTHWYRNEGWPLPGLKDADAIKPYSLVFDGKPILWPEGITVSLIIHKDGYRIHFPEAIFEENGAHKKLRAQVFELEQLLRWKYNGRIYAYSYYLYPPNSACDAVVDISDDQGDGKFRLLTSPGGSIMSPNQIPPAVPEWLKKARS